MATNNIGYKLVKNYTPTAEKAPYIGMAIPVGSLGFDDILDGMLEGGTFMTDSTARYFLTALYEYAAEEIAANVSRINIGSVAIYPAISGSFPTEDAPFDPTVNTLYVGATFAQELRDKVAGITPEYRGEEDGISSVRLSSVMDIATEAMGVINGTANFRLAGVNLAVPDGADESLALYSKDALTKICDILVSGNDGGLYLKCALPGTVSIAEGVYKIRLASHGLDPTDPLVVRTLNVTLVGAVVPVAQFTSAKQGTRADWTFAFGTDDPLVVTGTNLKVTDGCSVKLVADHDDTRYEVDVTSKVAASSTATQLTIGKFENTSELETAKWPESDCALHFTNAGGTTVHEATFTA